MAFAYGFNFWIFRGIPETSLKLNWSNNCQAEFYDSRGFLDGIFGSWADLEWIGQFSKKAKIRLFQDFRLRRDFINTSHKISGTKNILKSSKKAKKKLDSLVIEKVDSLIIVQIWKKKNEFPWSEEAFLPLKYRYSRKILKRVLEWAVGAWCYDQGRECHW